MTIINKQNKDMADTSYPALKILSYTTGEENVLN
jgi:hypothetical protein